MKNKTPGLFLASLGGVGVGYVLTNSVEFGLCIANGVTTQASCINFYERSGDAVFYGFLALSLVLFILLFVPRAFDAWKKFAIIALPLITLLFIFYPDPGAGDLFSPFPEQVYKWVSVLFAAISLGIIAWVKFLKK